MGFSVNFQDLNKFLNSAGRIEGDFNNFLRKFLIRMAMRVIAKAKPRTPVDTGALRAAWQLGEISGSGNDIEVEILNPMEYATHIEYGHRIVRGNVEVGWYEGRFMLKLSIDEIKAQMPAGYDDEFKRFCERRGLNAN